MDVLYITSDRPGAGKTALAAALAAKVSRGDWRVGYLKPLSYVPQQDADVEYIGRGILRGGPNGLQAVPLAVPESGADGQTLPEGIASQLKELLETLAKDRELTLVEGPSLTTPEGDASAISAGLVELMDAKAILVMHYDPGLSADRVIEACQPLGERLLGVLINSVTRYREREVRLSLGPEIESRGMKLLGAVPEDRLMLSVTVGDIARHLEARWALGEDRAGELVQNYLIGGNIMDRGTTYFGRAESKAVIVRGDRPDIQLAALSTPLTCLVLTDGHEPIQYVYYEAERQEVPVLVVQQDTISTAHAVDIMLQEASCRHPVKLERFQQLLSAYADLPSI